MSLINTRLQNMRAAGNLDKNETRPSRYGAFDAFAQMTDQPGSIITKELKDKFAISIGNTFQTPVIDYDGGISIGSTRSVTIADSENTSQLVTISATTYAFGFTIVPAVYMNNEIGQQADFERKMLKYIYALAVALDTAAVAKLSADKSQIFADALGYTVTSNVIQIPLAAREQALSDITPIMSANDYFGNLHIIGNGGVEALTLKLKQSGIWNDVNLQMEFLDKILHFSTRIANEVADYGNFYAVTEGNLGILSRVERESLLGTKTADGHQWSVENLPVVGIPVGTYFYESVGDFNAIAGAASADLTRARKEHYGFAVDIAFVTAYNSAIASKANPIAKVALLKA
ncbi:MAG: hypothetical protein ACOYMF_05990 [Bacteroidales bacterium]